MPSLNLGAANTRIAGFLNVDADPRWRPDVCALLTEVEFHSCSIDRVYCSHTLEHLPYPEAIAVLHKIGRWMKPGGTLWLAVPDFERLCLIVAIGEGDSDYIRNHFYGNTLEPWNPHRSGWTRPYLTQCLSDAGFEVIRDFEPWVRNVDDSGADASGAWFELSSGERGPLSLNLECRRREGEDAGGREP